MTISVIGHGYVGLVTAAIFADLGNTVWCVGRTQEKINNLKKGLMPFFEPGLEEVVKKNYFAKRLKFTLSYKEAIPVSNVIFICVGTPSLTNGDADLSQVKTAAKEIAENLGINQKIVVVKSTVPVGTTEEVSKIITKYKPEKSSFQIAFVPEFLREGTALQDTRFPDRIVIGSNSEIAFKILTELHRPIDGQYVLTNIPSAEMIKYGSNSLLATKISFANMMAFLCEKVGANVEQVLEGVGYDKRLGRSFLYPGVGYGGSCFPKDVKALISIFKKNKLSARLLEAVEEINLEAVQNFVNKVVKVFGSNLKGKTFSVLGLAFKPDTDDMREAPSIKIINSLQKMGVKIQAYDPVALETAQKVLENVVYCSSWKEAVRGTEAVLILTEWSEFKQLDLLQLKKLLKKPIVFDGRNIYNQEKIKKLGFTYLSVGR